jgi:hypothetical protein
VNVEVLLVVMLDELSVEETVREAGDKTFNPVCSLSDKVDNVPESVAVTLAVIWLV